MSFADKACIVSSSAVEDIQKMRLENENQKKLLEKKEQELKEKEEMLNKQVKLIKTPAV